MNAPCKLPSSLPSVTVTYAPRAPSGAPNGSAGVVLVEEETQTSARKCSWTLSSSATPVTVTVWPEFQLDAVKVIVFGETVPALMSSCWFPPQPAQRLWPSPTLTVTLAVLGVGC